uniref:Wsv134-like protein n=1 Tax=Melicertus latisulcatus pemonivirus TaxID=2984278 RepID=A0A9C7F6T5_9VIRU|nr:MAG: wsv134-like protein [Melicertus latisulcatus pemonivirus]
MKKKKKEDPMATIPASALNTAIGQRLVKSAVTRSALLERRGVFPTDGISAANSLSTGRYDSLSPPSTPTSIDIDPPPPLSTSNVPPSDKTPTASATDAWRKVPSFIDNPTMDNFALALDDITMSLLPPGMEDLRVIVVDSKNGIATFDKMDLRVAVVDGRMLVYPRDVSSGIVSCPFKNSAETRVFRPSDGLWLRACSPNFEMLRSQMLSAPNSHQWVASTAQIHQELEIPTSQSLAIQDILTYIVKR